METNFVEAAKWFRKAADQGISFAKCNLGALYFLGKGVEMDYAEARKWFTQAADEGDASAQINMGALYEHGHGVEANSAEVVKWYRKAADQGGAYAAFHMGEVLADTDKVMLQDYGVWGNKKFMGREFDGVHRTTFLIDEKGTILQIIDTVKAANHAQQVLECI